MTGKPSRKSKSTSARYRRAGWSNARRTGPLVNHASRTGPVTKRHTRSNCCPEGLFLRATAGFDAVPPGPELLEPKWARQDIQAEHAEADIERFTRRR